MPPKRKAAAEADSKRKKAKTGDSHSVVKFDLDWSMHGKEDSNGTGAIMVLDGKLPGCTKVASFDIDFTIIQTKSGRKFATGPADWKWLYSCIPEQLKALDKDGYRIVFFTNQAGIEKGNVKPTDFITKVNDIIEQLDIPIYTFVCTGQNEFRKPSTNMWDHFVKECNGGVDLDLSKCVYVGDAAGRPKNWAPDKPKDFSCSDRMFAANIGVEFKTPEEFFHKEKAAEFSWGSLDPAKFLEENKPSSAKEEYHSKKQELVLMVGPPASGKSTFSKRYLAPNGYVVVNRDTLKTPAKCLKMTESSLAACKSVVVDNTNPSKAVRADYLDLAKSEDVPARCFVLQTGMSMAHHLNYVRVTQTGGAVRRIPEVGYNMYKKNYQEPELSEGFTDVKKINFVPKFDSKKQEEIFKQWTTGGH